MSKIGALEIPPYAEKVGEGMARWKNPNNGFAVLLIHYTADPDKRTDTWKAQAVQGYTTQDWNQEFEIDFESWAGRPVYSSFRKRTHVSPDPLEWSRHRHMLRGWDIGIHAVVFAQKYQGQLSLFGSRQTIGAFGPREVRYREHEWNISGLSAFIDAAQDLSEEWFPGAQWLDYVDPAAWNDTIKHQGAPIREFQKAGLRPQAGATQNIPLRINAVEQWLNTMVEGQPAFQIDPRATVLIDAMAGGYKFDRKGQAEIPEKKSGFSHPMDALQYLCSRHPAIRTRNTGSEEILYPGMDPARFDIKSGTPSRGESSNWMDY